MFTPAVGSYLVLIAGALAGRRGDPWVDAVWVVVAPDGDIVTRKLVLQVYRHLMACRTRRHRCSDRNSTGRRHLFYREDDAIKHSIRPCHRDAM